MDIQARIPPALAAVHNYILKHDPCELELMEDQLDSNPGNAPEVDHGFGLLSNRHPDAAEKLRARNNRDKIAEDMWNSYQLLLAERGEAVALE